MLPDRPLTRRQLARKSGDGPDQIASFIASGLLMPPRRSRGREDNEAFHAEHLERLEFIHRATAVGLDLESIRLLLDANTANDVYRIVEKRRDSLRKSAGADDTVALLDGLLALSNRTGRRRECPILKALSGNT